MEQDPTQDSEQLSEKQKAKKTNRAYNIANWNLGQSDKSEGWLRHKLTQKEIPEPIIEEVIADFKERDLINDPRYAATYIRNKKDIGWGERKIYERLTRAYYITPETATQALEDEREDEDTQYEQLYELAERRLQTYPPSLPDDKAKARLIRFLAGRGFPPGLIFPIATQLINERQESQQE